VVVAELELSEEEWNGLAIGDLVVTDQQADATLSVFVEEGLAFQGSAGVWSGRKAIRLSEEASASSGGSGGDVDLRQRSG